MSINTINRPDLGRDRGLNVHIDDFRVDSSGSLNPGVLALRENLYGSKAGLYCEAIARNSKAAARLGPIIDNHAMAKIMLTWGINDRKQAEEFWIKQLRTANQTVGHIVDKTLFGWEQNYSLMEELQSPSENPSNIFKWSASAIDEGEKQMLYELGRQNLIALIASSINARTRMNRIGTIRDSIKYALYGLYERPVKPQPYTLVTEHDDQTGRVVRVGDVEFGDARETHMKIREYMVRSIEGIGKVKVGDRKKGDPEAAEKAMAKARDRRIKGKDGVIEIDDSTDTFGIKLTVMEPGPDGYDANIQRLEGLIIEHMRSYEKGANRLAAKILGFEPDNSIGSGLGSSKYSNFTRLQMYLEGVSVPFEIIFQNAAQMRNDEIMYGVLSGSVLSDEQYDAFQKETGVSLRGKLYDGSAHRLYEAQRLIPLLPVVFPRSIYGDELIERALENLHRIEAELRIQDRTSRFKFD